MDKKVVCLPSRLSIILLLAILICSPYQANAVDWESQSIPSDALLDGVWGSSSSDVFAIGNVGLTEGLILHYNGSSWSQMSCETVGRLFRIWGTSSNNVFTVGENGAILHYNGTEWSAMESSTTINLHSIYGFAPDDVFVVGGFYEEEDFLNSHGIILHYDGSSWTEVFSTDEWRLYDVWGSSADDIFVIGMRYNLVDISLEKRSCICHYDGQTWSVTPYQPDRDITLSGIWGFSDNDIYITGFDGTSDHSKILHYNGTTWSEVWSEVDLYYPEAIWGTSGNDLFVVGEEYYPMHYDGSTWTEMTTNPHEVTDDLYDIWGSADGHVFAVGFDGSFVKDGVILHYSYDPNSINTPDAPSNLTATVASSSQINLSWTDNSDNESGFKIERKTGSGSYQLITTVGAGATAYQNTGLSSDATYTYRIYAYNGDGNSGYSNEASATTSSGSGEEGGGSSDGGGGGGGGCFINSAIR